MNKYEISIIITWFYDGQEIKNKNKSKIWHAKNEKLAEQGVCTMVANSLDQETDLVLVEALRNQHTAFKNEKLDFDLLQVNVNVFANWPRSKYLRNYQRIGKKASRKIVRLLWNGIAFYPNINYDLIRELQCE